MKIVSLNGQMTFEEMKGSLERLPKTNRWVRMGDALPWAEYEKVYNKRLKNDIVGASNRPGRMAIAALIIKHKLSLSDGETILTIQENPYMQYMCGLTGYSDRPIFAPSLFTAIRKRITIEDIDSLTLEPAKKRVKRRTRATTMETPPTRAGRSRLMSRQTQHVRMRRSDTLRIWTWLRMARNTLTV